MAIHALDITRLEITKCKKKLASLYFELATTFALRFVVAKQTKYPGAASGLHLSRDQLVSKATFDALRDLYPELLPFFALADTAVLTATFATKHPHDDATITDSMAELDSDFKGVIMTRPPSAFGPCEQQRQDAAELKKALVPKAVTATNCGVKASFTDVAAAAQSPPASNLPARRPPRQWQCALSSNAKRD